MDKKSIEKKIIPVVYAVDDNYAPFLGVSLKSIIKNACGDYDLKVYILNTGITEVNKDRILKIAKDTEIGVSVEFVDVADRMDKIKGKTHLRDYYTNAIYYRIFIPSLFSQYEKVIYLDCDIVLLTDVEKLYDTDLGNNIVAAVHEEAMSWFDCFGTYSERYLGVPRNEYFNSGLLVINTKEYLKEEIETKFINLMLSYKMEVAPDQDYLNVLLHGKTKLLDIGWNKTPIPDKEFEDDKIFLVHFKLNFKPWHYFGIRYEEFFWKNAKDTPFYGDLIKMRDSFTSEEKKADEKAFNELQATAWRYVEKESNHIILFNREKKNVI